MKRKTNYRDTLHRLLGALVRKKNGKNLSNGDLRQHSFVMESEPLQKTRRRTLLALKKRIQLHRQFRQESYSSVMKKSRMWWKAGPACVVVSVILIFVISDGVNRVKMFIGDISFFQVRTLTFTGNEATSEARLRELAGVALYHSSLIGMDGTAIEERIEAEPWVSKATLRRVWPSAVSIDIIEHRPIALMNASTEAEPQLYYIDKTGISFLPVDPGQDVDYPVITGLDAVDDPQERADIFAEILVFLNRAGRNDPNLPAQSVSEVHVNAQGEMVVYLVEHPFPIFFGRGETATKYSRLVRVLESLYGRRRNGVMFSRVEYIRMDYLNDKVLVAQSESG